MNYRKFYQNQVGRKYDSAEFDIHHINGNRKDNQITNLVALPKKLHHQYHYYKAQREDDSKYSSDIAGTHEIAYAKYFIEKFIHNNQRFLEVLKEAAKWVDERDRLLSQAMGMTIDDIYNLESKAR